MQSDDSNSMKSTSPRYSPYSRSSTSPMLPSPANVAAHPACNGCDSSKAAAPQSSQSCPRCRSAVPESSFTSSSFNPNSRYNVGGHLCLYCRFPLPEPVTSFDDDEPLPSRPAPTPQPPPSATVTITSFPEFSAVAASDSPSDFAVLIKARAPPAPPETALRAPVDLVAVLDVSGSMFGHKLHLLKRAVRFIASTLSPSDRLSVVAFSSAAHRVVNLSRMSALGRARVSAALERLKPGGGTNILAGLETGVRVLEQRREKNPVAGLILLSDGVDSASIRGHERNRSEQEYVRLLPSNGVNTMPVHTFGFGSDHDPRAMHAISAASGGTFSFIAAEEAIQDAFALCIGGLLSVVAQQVELMVTAASAGVRIASVESGYYRSRVLNHGLAAAVEIGDLYADEEKDFLINISIPSAGGSTMPLLSVKCSYMDPSTRLVVHEDGETAAVARPSSLSPGEEAVSLMVDGQRNRVLVAESIREAQARAERGQLEGAKSVLAGRRSALLASPSAQSGDELCNWLETELREIEKRMASMKVYEESGRAYALAGVNSHMLQRAATRSGESDGMMLMGSARALQMRAQASPSTTPVMLSSRRPVRRSSGVVGYGTPAMACMIKQSRAFDDQKP